MTCGMHQCPAMNADSSSPAQPSSHTVPMALRFHFTCKCSSAQQRTACTVQHTTTAWHRTYNRHVSHALVPLLRKCGNISRGPAERPPQSYAHARTSTAARSFERLPQTDAHVMEHAMQRAARYNVQRPQPCHTTRTREDTGCDAACNRCTVHGAQCTWLSHVVAITRVAQGRAYGRSSDYTDALRCIAPKYSRCRRH